MFYEGIFDHWHVQCLIYIEHQDQSFNVDECLFLLYEVISQLINYFNRIGQGGHMNHLTFVYNQALIYCLKGLHFHRINNVQLLQLCLEIQHFGSVYDQIEKPKSLRFLIGKLMNVVSSIQFAYLEKERSDFVFDLSFYFKRFSLLMKTYRILLNIGNYLINAPGL